MAKVGSLEVDIALQSAQFIAGMKKVAAQTEATQASVQNSVRFMGNALKGLGVGLTVQAFLDATQRAFDFADAIVDLSDRTGASTKTIQEFRYAAQMSGSSMENADAALDKFTKNLGNASSGNKAMAASMAELGVKTDNVDEALKQAIDGISKLPSKAQQNAAAISLFGKSAADLTAILSAGNPRVAELAAEADRLGIVLEDNVLRNAGQVNDRLDTMKMILDAQFANAIVQNADALMSLANGFIQAAAAAVTFFSAMRNNAMLEVAEGNVPPIMRMFNPGKSAAQISGDARKQLVSTTGGRSALYDRRTQEYRQGLAEGRSKDDPYMMANVAERQDLARQEVAARRAGRRPPPKVTLGQSITAPASSAKPAKASSVTLKSDDDLLLAWTRDKVRARSELEEAEAALANTIDARREYEQKKLRDELVGRNMEIEGDTGTDREVKEGKKRYTAAQAELLKTWGMENFLARQQLVDREAEADLAKEKLALSQAGITNEADLLSADAALARSSGERRDIALRLLDLQYKKEKLELQAIVASGVSTQAEKDIAQARLDILDRLKARDTQRVERDNAGPLKDYLDSLPRTAGEINDAMEEVQVKGLEKLEDGLVDVIMKAESLGDVFKGIADSIIRDIMRIVIQQTLIKPIGALLGGGGDSGGGGWLGNILGTVVRSVASSGFGGGITAPANVPVNNALSLDLAPRIGARANGGMTQPGRYLVGERGMEVVDIGQPANVIPTAALDRAQGQGRNGPPVINITGPITSNDPIMMRQMIREGVMQATPFIAQQASDTTMKRLQRRQM